MIFAYIQTFFKLYNPNRIFLLYNLNDMDILVKADDTVRKERVENETPFQLCVFPQCPKPIECGSGQ